MKYITNIYDDRTGSLLAYGELGQKPEPGMLLDITNSTDTVMFPDVPALIMRTDRDIAERTWKIWVKVPQVKEGL